MAHKSRLFKIRQILKSKTIVLVLSSMRSGSTLLKSLMATAPDISHLPETDFQAFAGSKRVMLKTLSDKRIILVKKPAPYNSPNYPELKSFENTKKIILVRDVYDTVTSLKNMNDDIDSLEYNHMDLTYLAETYWFNTYDQILNKTNLSADKHLLVRFEDLVSDPIRSTKALFKFIGSMQQEGVTSYAPPKDYKWSWGNDDGGDLIKSLKVNPSSKPKNNEALNRIIDQSAPIQALRKRLGYS